MIIDALYAIFESLYTTLFSSVLGVDVKTLKKIFEKTQPKEKSRKDIGESIDAVSQKLEESKDIIDNALAEIERQKILFEQLKKEAEISEKIKSMNNEQMEALNTVLESTLNKQEKKSSIKNFLWNLFFCILSAVLGYLLGKFI